MFAIFFAEFVDIFHRNYLALVKSDVVWPQFMADELECKEV